MADGFEEFIDKRVEAKRLTSALLTGVEIGEGTLLSGKLFIFWTERERKGSGHKCFQWYLIHMKLDSSQRICECEQYFFNVKLLRGSLARAT